MNPQSMTFLLGAAPNEQSADPYSTERATSQPADLPERASAGTSPPTQRASTFVVFSGELDKQLVAFTLANAAAASGMAVTMFFTFWSLAALRRPAGPAHAVTKPLIERLFGRLLPRGAGALPLSNFDFLGCGRALIRWRMRQRGMASLEQQIETARALGVRFVACEASMDVMGFRLTDLLEGVEVGGAMTCLAAASESDVAMVI